MGELEGSYRVIQTPGTRLGAPFNAGISTLEAGQALSANMSAAGKNYGRGLQMRVVGLDDSQEFYDMETKSLGQTLLSEVFQRGNLIENDYFGLEFQNTQMNWVWLEPIKPIVRQVRRPANTLFRLSVKFFPPDPGQIQEEYTRYLFSLQMKRDLMESRLLCTENTGALLASHLVQSEIGDYDELSDRDYLRLNTLLPYQDKVQDRVMDFHRRHLGQTPAESDFQVLEIARKLEMYGVRFHPASDREGTKINLSVAHMGLQVFQGNTRINTFNWSKIRKLSFKRKRFLIKLHPEVHGPHQDTLEFLMGSRDQCKIFWKNCVEHHSFFRLLDQPLPPTKAILFSRGSSFRYSGRTQKQLVDYVRDSGTKRTPYQRRNSKIRSSARSLAYDMPKLNLSFSDSLRGPGPRASASPPLSYQHSLLSSSSLQRSLQGEPPLPLLGHPPAAQTPPALEPRLRPPQTHGPAPPSPPRDAPAAAPAPSSRCAVQGAPSLQLSVVESSTPPSQTPHTGGQQGGRRGAGAGGRAGGAGGVSVRSMGVLTPAAFQAEVMRSAPLAAAAAAFPRALPPLRVSGEFIDDDPAEISFYGGAALQAYALEGPLGAPGDDDDDDSVDRYGYGEEAGPHGDDPGAAYSLDDLSVGGGRYGDGALGRSETSSLVNNRSECSSLDHLGGLSSAGEGGYGGAGGYGGYGGGGGGGGGGDGASLRLPGSENPSGASSLVNFPAYSERSETGSAVQFSDLLEQLEQLSYPPTATDEPPSSSSSSDDSEGSDWGSDGGLPPEQSLFYSNPLTGAGGIDSFLLQCHSLQALALAEPPGPGALKM
ncbi:unnamed protein product [Boreogadus saida]